MGWKNVKEHYRIGHIVQVTDQGICIGSPYIHDIIVIGINGVMKKRLTQEWNGDLSRYQAEMDADPEELRRLVLSPDTFAKDVPVFTYDGREIIQKFCEEPRWPNVTHDGALMFANAFSTDKAYVVERAKRGVDIEIECWRKQIMDAEMTLAQHQERLKQARARRAKLEMEYPASDPWRNPGEAGTGSTVEPLVAAGSRNPGQNCDCPLGRDDVNRDTLLS